MTAVHTRTQDTVKLLHLQVSLPHQILLPGVNNENQIVIVGVIVPMAAVARLFSVGIAMEIPRTLSLHCLAFFIILFFRNP
jgi:hypothetical protein